MWRQGLLAAVVVSLLCGVPSAEGAFPGANGKIAYTNVFYGAKTINPDGTGDAAFETGE